jgi:phosphatidate cytidylyltransferase
MAIGDGEDSGETGAGRHGGSAGGLSAAELIARSRAATPGAPQGPSRAARRAATQETDELPIEVDVVPAAGLEQRQLRHLTAVEDTPEVLPEPEPKSRAGRNLPVAIGVGLGLGGLILATLFSYRPSFVVVVVAAILIGVYEMVTAISTVEARPPLVPLLVGAAAMDVAAWFRGADGLVGALLLTVLGLAIWRLGDGASGYLRDVASAGFVALYVPFLAGFAVLLTHPHDGAARVVIFILSVVCSDTGGYATGVLFGKHPMAPTVSPKKSWEGFIGSALACCACGVLVMHFTFHQEWWKGALYGLAIVVTATLGDLGESMIKRDLGLKDMGRLLPGHGGIMDRLDSLLPCAAVAYLLLAAFVPS